MDAVYILGSGSLANNLEILYSIRSLEKHMLDLVNIYVIGDEPLNVPGVEHIHAYDRTRDKWVNAYEKVIRACDVPQISEEFLLMNDDFFLTENMLGSEWPFYALKGSNGGSCGPLSFHVHCPVRVKKEWYKNMPFSCDQKACRSPRSFYANFYHAPPKFSDDFVLRVGHGMRPADVQISSWPCFTISDSAMLDPDFVLWLHERYPDPSRFEK